jgi:hypothetical protein
MNVPQNPKVPIYRSDGNGRDTYIVFSNGGFNNYPYSRSYKKDSFTIPTNKSISDLFKRRPIDKYVPDGRGRDYFIFRDIQNEHDRLADIPNFENILRKRDSSQDYLRLSKNPSSKFEKRLINRIFYGKCPGMKDRQMSPKVRFKEDIEKEKLEKEMEENKNSEDIFSKKEDSQDENSKNMKTLSPGRKSHKIFSYNDKNDHSSLKKKENMFISPFSAKKKSSRYNEIDQSENLLNSVKKIFLYNSRNRAVTESYNK